MNRPLLTGIKWGLLFSAGAVAVVTVTVVALLRAFW